MSEDPEGSASADELLAELRVALARLYRHAGEPSTRTIAVKLDRALSHTTVNAVLKCGRTPRWGQLELVVQALDGRVDEFHRRWVSIRDAEHANAPAANGQVVRPDDNTTSGEIRVVEDHASLRFDEGTYTLTQKRLIANAGGSPVNGYLVRIHVDRFLHFNRLSELYHLQYPLRSDDLGFSAWYGPDRTTRLIWANTVATSSIIEGWLQFEDATGGAGLEPGAKTWIEYEYYVPQSQWGNWFQRAVRHRTDEVSVTLDFPAELVFGPDGVTLSSSSPTSPQPGMFVRTDIPVSYQRVNRRSVYRWSARNPALHGRYRAEWNFPFWPTAQMKSAGVLQYQDDNELLTRPTGSINFAASTAVDDVERIARRLTEVADEVAKVHRFTNGMGLAAPQVGIDKQVVLLRGADGRDTFLVNPRVVRKSGKSLATEGCLSFFDVRGEFPRPDSIDVTYRTLDGSARRKTYTERAARDVAHEIDHLKGKVFVDRMTPRDNIFLAPHLRKPA